MDSVALEKNDEEKKEFLYMVRHNRNSLTRLALYVFAIKHLYNQSFNSCYYSVQYANNLIKT